MKLITHNILMCNKKGCTKNNFPLKLIVTKFEDYEGEESVDFNKVLVQRLCEKVDWAALQATL